PGLAGVVVLGTVPVRAATGQPAVRRGVPRMRTVRPGGQLAACGGLVEACGRSAGSRRSPAAQRPSKTGFSLARKAATALWWSAEAPVLVISSASWASDSLRG